MLKHVKSARKARMDTEELPPEVLPEDHTVEHEAPADGEVVKDDRPGSITDKSETEVIDAVPGTEEIGDETTGEYGPLDDDTDEDALPGDLTPDDIVTEEEPEVQAVEALMDIVHASRENGATSDLLLFARSRGLLASSALESLDPTALSLVSGEAAIEGLLGSAAQRVKALVAKATIRMKSLSSSVNSRITSLITRIRTRASEIKGYVIAHPVKSAAIVVATLATLTAAIVATTRFLSDSNTQNLPVVEFKKELRLLLSGPLVETKKKNEIALKPTINLFEKERSDKWKTVFELIAKGLQQLMFVIGELITKIAKSLAAPIEIGTALAHLGGKQMIDSKTSASARVVSGVVFLSGVGIVFAYVGAYVAYIREIIRKVTAKFRKAPAEAEA